MKILDISQEIFGCRVYPGDRKPEKVEEMRMSCGDAYNLTSFSMCAHNGTHVDAPVHFLEDGAAVDQIPLEKTVGPCWVSLQQADLTGASAGEILKAAGEIRKILIKGKGVVTLEAACVFAEAQLDLIGVEGLSVGPEDSPKAVHQALLRAGTVLLEGICLENVEPGAYFLSAAPISLAGSDGAPCRAILIDTDK